MKKKKTINCPNKGSLTSGICYFFPGSFLEQNIPNFTEASQLNVKIFLLTVWYKSTVGIIGNYIKSSVGNIISQKNLIEKSSLIFSLSQVYQSMILLNPPLGLSTKSG